MGLLYPQLFGGAQTGGDEVWDVTASKRGIWKQEECSAAHSHLTPLEVWKSKPSFSDRRAFRNLWSSHFFPHVEGAKIDQIFSI